MISELENDASEIERHLRESGLPVRMNWLKPSDDLADKLRELSPDLVLCDQRVVERHSDYLHLCTRTLPYTPVLLLAEDIHTELVTFALRQRARDVVSTRSMDHLHAVYLRELGVARLQHQLNHNRTELEELEQRLEAIMDASEAAVIQLQEGIIIEANPSFAKLFGFEDEHEAIGLPFLDYVAASDQKNIKKQISRCSKGRKVENQIRFKVHTNTNAEVDADLELKLVQFEGEPAVELHIKPDEMPAPAVKAAETSKAVEPAAEPVAAEASAPKKTKKQEKVTPEVDPRIAFYKTLENPKHYPPKGSGLSLGYIVADNSVTLKKELGLAGADQFLARIAGFLTKQMPGAKVYRLATDEFVLVAPGKLFKHGETFARNFCKQINDQIFDYDGKSVVFTISIAITRIDEAKNGGIRFTEARDEARKISNGGGNGIVVCGSADQETQTEEPMQWDELQNALTNNRLRIATRPIASLEGDARHYYELHPRVPDDKGELAPIEGGGPQATHASLQIELDRKLIQLALGFLKRAHDNNEESGVFIPLSSCSAESAEETVSWLIEEHQKLKLGSQEIVLSLSEEILVPHIHRLNDLINKISGQPVKFAISDCVGNEQSLRLIQHLPAGFLRLTPASTRALCEPNSEKSRGLLEAVSIAREHGYKIIAAATGDAHSMAVMWQLGVNYVESSDIAEPAAA